LFKIVILAVTQLNKKASYQLKTGAIPILSKCNSLLCILEPN